MLHRTCIELSRITIAQRIPTFLNYKDMNDIQGFIPNILFHVMPIISQLMPSPSVTNRPKALSEALTLESPDSVLTKNRHNISLNIVLEPS